MGRWGFPKKASVGCVPNLATVRSSCVGTIPGHDQQGSEVLEGGQGGLGILTIKGRCLVGAGE